MRERLLQLNGQGPRYRQLVTALRDQAGRGELGPGALLPSTRELAERLGLHRHTVAAAFQELVAEGWVQGEPGRGFRVCHRPLIAGLGSAPAEPAQTPEAPAPAPLFRFPSGHPDLRLFPREEYFSIVRRLMRDLPPDDLLGYSDPAGRPALRERLCRFLQSTRGLQVVPEQVVVTHGCQEAIFLIAQTLISRGQTAAVEERGFSPVWEALAQSGAEIEPLAVDEQGLVPEAVAELCRRKPPALLYLTPIHQYPTTVTLSLPRRQALYELAVRHNFYILEDDYDNEFHFGTQPPAPMKADDPCQRILYCATFSKLLAPSLRLGFAVLPLALAERVTSMKRIASRQNDNLSQEAVSAWMDDGGFERHLRRMRRRYQSRRQTLLREVERWNWRYQPSGGGMSVWVDFGRDSAELSQAALEKGIQFRPGHLHEFSGQTSTKARLGFCQPDEDEIVKGLAALAGLMGSFRTLDARGDA